VRSLDRQEVLYTASPDVLLMPASAMKVVTLATAASRLGWNYTFETRLLGIGAVDLGVLDGDLVVVGGGDPSIDDWDGGAARLFQGWADRLKAAGVRTIGGRIVGDDNQFEDEGLGSGWMWDDLGASFATGAGALQFNQNTARARIVPGAVPGEPALIEITPTSSGLTVRNRLTTSVAEVAPAVELRRAPGSDTVEIRGVVPGRGAPFFRNLSVDNPTLYFVTALREALVENGIEVRGPAVDIDSIPDPPRREDGVTLVTHRSAPLSALSVTMMKLSQNLYAETLLRAMADGEVRETASGREAALAVLDGWQVDRLDVLLADGSGLSRYDLITASALAIVLARVAADATMGPTFEASLPVAGQDGTLAGRMAGTRAEGNARAKTGSFSNARALAGYVRTADGERLAFAMMANNFGTPPDIVERAMDAMVVRLAEFTRR
jgi:D-alanyl-D-alanine carboxypeptidase/D-alanyl-D-alanine-endopeptidase (penicillin-binding protein 4)